MKRSVRRVCLVAAAVACLLVTESAVSAQEIGGSVEGTVTGPDGQPLPGVTVTIQGSGLPGGMTVTTNESGHYRLPTVPPAPTRSRRSSRASSRRRRRSSASTWHRS